MKLRIGKKGISISAFKLTSAEIEQQAVSDLLNYHRTFLSRYGKKAINPLDVESFIKELWNIEVDYDSLPQSDNEEILGLFEPDKQRIIIDPKACNNKGRTSFTVAHEAGHLSLHSFLFVFNNGKITGWKNAQPPADKNIEKQADLYAASLLAPEREIYDFLREKGLLGSNTITSPIDLLIHGSSFQDRFGLSRQALEIRLSRLKLPMLNKKYGYD